MQYKSILLSITVVLLISTATYYTTVPLSKYTLSLMSQTDMFKSIEAIHATPRFHSSHSTNQNDENREKRDSNFLESKNITSQYIHDYIVRNLRLYSIPSAAVSVVQNGRVVISNGYYYNSFTGSVCDYLDNKKCLVSAVTSQFRTASVTKTFTALGIMMLVEKNVIQIHEDVNKYIDFPIRAPLGTITVKDLLTHLSGFEERILGQASRSDPVPLEQFLKTNQPAQVHKPGTVRTYSNYAVSLAGYIIQKKTGVEYSEWMKKNILDPLNMTHSTFSQVNIDYNLIAPSQTSSPLLPREYSFNHGPAGALLATADDMTNYILMLTNKGKFGNTTFLNDKNWNYYMGLSSQLRDEPLSMGMIWYMDYFNDYVSYNHGGDLFDFASHLSVIPELNVSYWISFGKGGAAPRASFYHSFADYYFPRKNYSNRVVVKNSKSNLFTNKEFVSTRRPYTTSDAFVHLLPSILAPYFVQYSQTDDTSTLLVSGLEFPYQGFDNYSFANNKDTFQFKNYPFMIFSNNDANNYFIAVEAVAGFEGVNIRSSGLFFFIGLFNLNFIFAIVYMIYHCAVCCCCPAYERGYTAVGSINQSNNEVHKPTYTAANILIIAYNVLHYAMCFIITGSVIDSMFGNFTSLYMATIIPLINIVIFVALIGVFIYTLWARLFWSVGFRILYVLFLLVAIFNIVCYFLANLVGPSVGVKN